MNILLGPLVRAVSSTCVTIWVETSQPAQVTLLVESVSHPELSLSSLTSTVQVGGHFYAAPQLSSLLPFAWYTYKLIITTQDNHSPKSTVSSDSYCFRTLVAKQLTPVDRLAVIDVASPSAPAPLLRVAYGSCRKLSEPTADTLGAYGDWLLQHEDERDTLWPHVLLLIGDQIYADEPPALLQNTLSTTQKAAFDFADFARLYIHAWTITPGIRQLLAHIPTLMIFDDHEITNNWNLFSGWRANALRQGQEQVLVDGMVAYWIYQGWGNLLPDENPPHPLLSLMQEATQSGDDVLEALRSHMRDEVYGKTLLPWHYTIPTIPPIFMTNVRAERSAVFSTDEDDFCTSTRIMSNTQMQSLKNWLATQSHQPALVVSSVPVLLPPLIGLAEYLMGVRPLQNSRIPLLRYLGLRLARLQLRMAIRTSFDHWPVFADTWQELTQVLLSHASDVLVLSGDVHFSYAAVARPLWGKRAFRLYQFVCSPFENSLETKSQLQILLQSFFSRSIYGGMSTRILPLHKLSPTPNITRQHLFQRAIAVVTIQQQSQVSQQVSQEYLGFVAGKFQRIASTTL